MILDLRGVWMADSGSSHFEGKNTCALVISMKNELVVMWYLWVDVTRFKQFPWACG